MERFMLQTNNINFYPIVFLLSILFPLNAIAQLSEEFELNKNKYPESHIVRLLDEVVISVELKNNNIEIEQSFIEEDLYLDKTATYGSKRALNFSTFYELNSVEATSYEFSNGKYRAYEVEDFIEKDELGRSFHDDTKSLNFIFPKLSVGGKTKLQYTEIVKNPRFLSPIYFGDFFPIQKKKVTLIADKDISFRFQEFNTEDFDITFNKKEKRGNIIYTWELSEVNRFKREPNVPTYKRVLPHIVPMITAYKIDGKTVNVLNDVSDLYSWYYSLVKDINTSPSDKNLVILVNDLIKDKDTDIEKVRAIYYWTQRNIKYIDFEYALGGFVPREANEVFNKKYGDCKDNSSILFEMLKIAGLEGHLTWIGTRTIPYSYREVPTPIVDNHMILSIDIDNKTYFLDATGRYLPLEMPSSFIQGKEALISKGESDFKIKNVPIMSPKVNSYIEHTELSINDNQLIGKSKTQITGYYKIDYFVQLEDEDTDLKLKEYYNIKLRKGNNKFLIDSLTETNKYEYDKDFIIDYNFKISDYIKNLGDEIYVNLNLNQDLKYFKTEEDREHDTEMKYKSYYDYKTSLKIPKEYTIDYLPENFSLHNDYFDFDITYNQTEDSILYTHQLKMKFLTLNPKQQKEVNAAIKKSEKNFKEVVVLKKQ
ncbi:transglutaminase-like domain-containing protein [Psychroserpens sp. S379A]|uniref:transglutaminase-like domain-containing protein n=1 Tax=Psychroserpens sp. S379A TaxID=3415137 RepID=UPI003C7D6DDF